VAVALAAVLDAPGAAAEELAAEAAGVVAVAAIATGTATGIGTAAVRAV
jgi:hypothetical protein